ncbi:TetR family transcriptional regulator [Mycobacterium sp. Z3061]|uniref:TetR family transcriptional regulator n=1 Tax=Mycobacterium sp. Z3061 TaxID=3073562 RepID=UPI002877DB25|nr:TetR family transcriptional regulator [Mycobacterium sp. Z3061]
MNREHLLRATADFLSRRPNASQDEIAAAVGVSRATLHRQFAGREALLEALDVLAITTLRDALQSSRWQEGPPVEGLRRLVAACEPAAGYVAFLHSRNEAAERRQSRAGWDEINGEIERFFLHGQQAGAFRPDVTAVWLTEVFYSLVSGAKWSIQLGRAASRDFTRMITELMLHGVRAATRGNLPAPLPGFVGRAAELAELDDMIAASRLVTLTGIGGIGKSTLALQAARQRVADFSGGVWLIELGELSDGEPLAAVAAAALGVRDLSARPLLEVMVEALADREALLVLDNCELVLDATVRFVETLLAGCPKLRILATSREILDIDGESVLPVPPLPVPDTDSASREQLASCDAVALFLKHARATQRSFSLTERNAPAVARICNQLDGLPLAIELAAPLLRTMSIEQIAARISSRFKLLSHGKRGASGRQQTLNYCIAWSYQRCTEAERQLWSGLSVFAGSFEPAAVQHVCAPDTSEDKLLEMLCTLVDKSILIRTPADDAVYFRQLATLREYGHNQLSSDEQAELRRRHLDWYHRLAAEQAGFEWYGEHQVVWLQRLRRETSNLRAALRFALDTAPSVALEMATHLRGLWTAIGMMQQGRRWIEQALDVVSAEPSLARLAAVISVAETAVLQVDIPTLAARQAEARQLLTSVTEERALAHFTANEAALALLQGQPHSAQTLAEQSLNGTTYVPVQIYALLLMIGACAAAGDAHTAIAHAERGLALSEAHGHDIVLRTYLLAALGLSRLALGELDQAEQCVREGLQLARMINDSVTCATFLETASWIAAARQDPRRAAVLMAAAAAIGRAAGATGAVSAYVGPFHEACELQVREQLAPADYRAATNEGRLLSLDDAVAIVLEELV